MARRLQALVLAFAVSALFVSSAANAQLIIEEDPPDEPAAYPVLQTALLSPGAAPPEVAVTDAELESAGRQEVGTLVLATGPGVLIVDDDRSQCPNAQLTTPAGIQLAIDAAAPGDSIRVCPGRYDPITVDKAGLRLQAPRPLGQSTECQADPIADPAQEAIIEGAREGGLVTILAPVTFEGFTVQGNLLDAGIETSAQASGYVLRHNVVQGNVDGVDLSSNGAAPTQFAFNCVRDNGLVFAGTGGTGVTSSFGISNARVEENTVSGHDCGSIALTGPRSCLALPSDPLPPVTNVVIAHNDVLDDSRIAVVSATDVAIEHNFVSLQFGPGILLSGFGSPVRRATIRFNHIDGQNNVITQGIFVTPSGPSFATDVSVMANKVENLEDAPGLSRADGIVVRGIQVQVLENWVRDNRGSGIELRAGFEHLVRGNLIVENGVAAGDVSDGIRVFGGAVRNAIENNRLRLNVTHDCHDSNAQGANVWLRNVGDTENQPGLCSREVA